MAAECLWAPSFPLRHSHRQSITETGDVPEGHRNSRGRKCVRDDRIERSGCRSPGIPTASGEGADVIAKDTPILGDSRGRRNIEFGQLTSKKRVLGEFRDELRKLF